MAEFAGLRKDPRGYVVAITPDVCKLPNGTPTPFPIFAQFSWAVREVATVRFEGLPVTNENSRLSRVVGDEAGTGGGITSLVNMGMCRPVPGLTSPSLKVGGHPLIHATRGRMEMNCNGPDGPGNTVGRVIWASSPPTGVAVGPDGEITGATNPPVEPETEEEEGWFSRAFDKVKDAASGMSASDWAHLGLGALSVIPGVGTVAALADAALYAKEGNKVGVAFALGAALPGGKIIGAGIKMGGRAAKVALAAQRAGRVGGKALAVGSVVIDPLGSIAGTVLGRAAGAATRRGSSAMARRAAARRAQRETARRAPPRPPKRDGGHVEGGGSKTVCRHPDGAACRTDPVDTVSGRVLLEATDVELPGPLPFRLERTWLTGMRVTGRFGAGWTSTLDAAVLVDRAGGTAFVRLPDGTSVRLVLPDAGGETPVREHGFRLRAETDGPDRASGDRQAGAAPLAPLAATETGGDGQSGARPGRRPSRRQRGPSAGTGSRSTTGRRSCSRAARRPTGPTPSRAGACGRWPGSRTRRATRSRSKRTTGGAWRPSSTAPAAA